MKLSQILARLTKEEQEKVKQAIKAGSNKASIIYNGNTVYIEAGSITEYKGDKGLSASAKKLIKLSEELWNSKEKMQSLASNMLKIAKNAYQLSETMQPDEFPDPHPGSAEGKSGQMYIYKIAIEKIEKILESLEISGG